MNLYTGTCYKCGGLLVPIRNVCLDTQPQQHPAPLCLWPAAECPGAWSQGGDGRCCPDRIRRPAHAHNHGMSCESNTPSSTAAHRCSQLHLWWMMPLKAECCNTHTECCKTHTIGHHVNAFARHPHTFHHASSRPLLQTRDGV